MNYRLMRSTPSFSGRPPAHLGHSCEDWAACLAEHAATLRTTTPVVERELETQWEQFQWNPPQWWNNRSKKSNCKQLVFTNNVWAHQPGYGHGFCNEEPRRGAAWEDDLQVATWSKLCEEGDLAATVKALDLLVYRGSYVKTSVFYGVLKRCIAQKDVVAGKHVHALAVKSGYESNAFLANHIICMYASTGRLDEATHVFSNVATPDRYMWASIILAHARHGQAREAIELYKQMRGSTVKPDNHIFVAVLKACATAEDLVSGREVHADIVGTAVEPNVFVGNCLVDMYSKCGSLDDARGVFDCLPYRDVVTWNAMITGYVQHDLGEEALALYGSMQQEGITLADPVTFICLLQACGNVAALEKGREVHARVSQSGLETSDSFVANTLIDMYGKCGSMIDAQHVFEALPTRDIVTWNALIAGYARLGENQLVFDLFQNMTQDGIQPDRVTFLSVLTACSHGGLVDLGHKYFEAMHKDYGVDATIEHFTCMVDLLCRAGQVEEAMEFVKSMPFQPDNAVWTCALGGCRKWSNVELGRQAFESAMQLDTSGVSPYFLMSNIYTAAQMPDYAKEIQLTRVNAQAWKKPGKSSWTDIRGVVHTFLVGDLDHLCWQHILSKLEDLANKMEECNRKQDSLAAGWVIYN